MSKLIKQWVYIIKILPNTELFHCIISDSDRQKNFIAQIKFRNKTWKFDRTRAVIEWAGIERSRFFYKPQLLTSFRNSLQIIMGNVPTTPEFFVGFGTLAMFTMCLKGISKFNNAQPLFLTLINIRWSNKRCSSFVFIT